MAKNLLKGMAALAICAAFASCSHDPGFETVDEFEQAKNEYKTNFIQKYGEIDPNQTWDFTSPVYLNDQARAFTRGEIITEWDADEKVHISMLDYEDMTSAQFNADKNYIIANLNNVETSRWDNELYGKVRFWAYFTHGNGSRDVYYRLGVHWEENGQTHNTQLLQAEAKYDRWATGYNHVVAGKGYEINTEEIIGAQNMYWWVTATQAVNFTNKQAEVESVTRLENFKVITVPRGATYWCFDCDCDGTDYSDLICLVNPVVIGKRYLIEDLGATKDFDFNDIVVDVFDYNGEQKAIIRAMGGTLDFTLTIGETTWSKVDEGFVEETMYNTKPQINWDENLAEFTVKGWDPINNNISLTVKKSGKQSEGTYFITFPKQGDVPMIVAVDPIRHWMEEYVSVPKGWFTE